MWNLMVNKPTPGPEILEAIDALEFEGEAAPHVMQQIDAAKAGAKGMISTGAYGPIDDPEIHYHIALAGHANPGHQPIPGYENDTGTVHIIQVGKVPEQEAPAPAPEGADPKLIVQIPPPVGEPPAAGDGEQPDAEPKTPPVAGSEGSAS